MDSEAERHLGEEPREEMRHEVRLAGMGGQGLVLAGVILSEAVLRSGRNVAMSQAYGPQTRGGISTSEVIIDDEEIYYPRVSLPDVLLIMSQPAFERYGHDLRPGGTLIINSTEVEGTTRVEGRVLRTPITQLARERAKAVVANIVALGVIGGATGMVSKDDLKVAVLAHIPKGTEALNEGALELGWAEGERCVITQ